jgi:hypothetical protein
MTRMLIVVITQLWYLDISLAFPFDILIPTRRFIPKTILFHNLSL